MQVSLKSYLASLHKLNSEIHVQILFYLTVMPDAEIPLVTKVKRRGQPSPNSISVYTSDGEDVEVDAGRNFKELLFSSHSTSSTSKYNVHVIIL